MVIRNVVLTEHFDNFISCGVEEGRYSDPSEVVLDGLRLLEQRHAEDKAKTEWLRGAVQESIDSLDRGEGKSFSSMDELAEHIRGMRLQAPTEVEVEHSGAA